MTTSPRVCAVEARITRADHVCSEHIAIEIELDEFPSSQPGQFLQIACRDINERDIDAAGSAAPLLRRPFSIADRYETVDGKTRLLVISRDIGIGTHWLDQRRVGQPLNVSGPLGRGFCIAAEGPHVLIGGGVGIPPMLYLARRLRQRGVRDAFVIFGTLRRDLLPVAVRRAPDPQRAIPCLELPGDADYPALVTTDDGSLGTPGRVTDALAALARQVPLAAATVYACGPEPMLHAVAEHSRALNCACQLCIEKVMGCGIGTCLSCIVARRDAGRPNGRRWALSCTEGPVFDRDDLCEFAAAPAAGDAKAVGPNGSSSQ